jgi:release factor glutamine methyltransferase
MTYGEALAKGRAGLAAAEDAALDARLLLATAAGLDMAALVARSRDPLPAVAEARYGAYVKRRGAGEPVARILGEAEFWGLRLKLNAATLVPRPDTETLVESVLDEARRRGGALALCDLGTGSGAIAIALLSELPEARAVATDISEEALQAARANAEAHGVTGRMRFLKIGFAEGPEGPFDIVVSNPPYVRSDTIAGLPAEVRKHDPRIALDGGADGLAAYRAILSRIGKLVAPGGFLAFEVGYDQGESVAALCRQAGLSEVGIRRDLGGRERVVSGRQTFFGANPKVAKKALGKVG